jgi:hypothetical protein
MVFSTTADATPAPHPSSLAPAARSARPPGLSEEDIDIPGTHVPPWVVVVIVVAVILVLAGTAFLLLA